MPLPRPSLCLLTPILWVLLVGTLHAQTAQQKVILPFGSEWEWLHPSDGVDPSLGDPDFDTTWHTPSLYDGPVFSGPDAALFGYGAIDLGPIATSLATPLSGQRFTAYFRTSFTLPESRENLFIEVFADDGTVIYLDGAEAARSNYAGPDLYTGPAEVRIGESAPVPLSLGSIAAGEHVLAVSVHNADATSSDLGFDAMLYEQLPDYGAIKPGRDGVTLTFQDAAPGATRYEGGSNGNDLGWIGNGSAVRDFGGDHAYVTSSLTGQFLRTDHVDIRGEGPVGVSIDFRTENTSTGFESDDMIRAWVEGSFNGIHFLPLADLIPTTTGGRELDPPDDQLTAYDLGGAFTTFAIAPGSFPADLRSLRVLASMSADSPNERLILDNIRFFREAGTLRLTGIDGHPDQGVNIRFASTAGSTYNLEASLDLERWTPIDSLTAAGSASLFTVAPPLDPELFFRVVQP